MTNFFDKKTVSKIKQCIATTALNSIPVAGNIAAGTYELIDICVSRARELKNKKSEQRLIDFYNHLSPEGTIKTTKEVNIDDYTKIIESMIRDDEDEKVAHYSYLFESILSQNLDRHTKVYFIKWIRELSSLDISIMRKIYVQSSYSLKRAVVPGDILGRHSISKLKKLLIVSSEQKVGLLLTELGELFLKSIFAGDQLKPESVGTCELSRISFSMISLSDLKTQDYKKHQVAIDRISSMLLDEFHCKSSSSILLNSQAVPKNFFFSNRIVLIHDGKIKEEYTEKVIKRILSNGGISICVSDAPETNTLRLLPKTNKTIAYSIRSIEKELQVLLEEIRSDLQVLWKLQN